MDPCGAKPVIEDEINDVDSVGHDIKDEINDVKPSEGVEDKSQHHSGGVDSVSEDKWPEPRHQNKRLRELSTHKAPLTIAARKFGKSTDSVNHRKSKSAVKRFSLEDWYETILQMDLHQIGLASSDIQECEEVPLRFESPDQYLRIFMPLVLLELKAQLKTAYTSLEQKHSGIFSVSEDVGNSRKFVILRPDDPKTRYLSVNDLILFTKSLPRESNAGFLGKVEKSERKSTSQIMYMVCLEKTYVMNLLKRRHWNVSRVLELTTHIREVEALLSFKDLPLHRWILET